MTDDFSSINDGRVVDFPRLEERREIRYYDLCSSYPAAMMKPGSFKRPFLKVLDNLPHLRIRRGHVAFIPATGMCAKQRAHFAASLVGRTTYHLKGRGLNASFAPPKVYSITREPLS